MRTFDHPNTSGGWVCPICGKNDDSPVVLIPIMGTQDGSIVEARQYHLSCFDLCEYKNGGERMLGQVFIPKDGK